MTLQASKTNNVVVIGGGWSGLSAACYLANNNYTVSIYESSKHLGGRARGIQLENISKSRVDNGQHLLIGAYRETLELMRLISSDISEKLQRQNLSLKMFNKKSRLFLSTVNLPSPLHLLVGLLSCTDLSFSQKLRVFYFSIKLSSKSILGNKDISVEDLLRQNKQTDKLINALWEPLCIATLNTPINKASAIVFVTVLQKSLLNKKSDSDFLFTINNLSSIIPDPARQFLLSHNCNINTSSRVSEIIFKNNSIEGVIVNDELIQANHVILAIPPYACLKLLADQKQLNTLNEQLSQFEYQPICTIYLQYPEETTMNQSMIGSWGTLIQWLFDRKIVKQNGLMAAVISADGPHMDLDNESLIKQVEVEIQQIFPDWPAPLYSKVVREKRATFSCNVNISNSRPNAKTPVKGLWLCGDYTNTELPATLEGAVISGKLAANEINLLESN